MTPPPSSPRHRLAGSVPALKLAANFGLSHHSSGTKVTWQTVCLQTLARRLALCNFPSFFFWEVFRLPAALEALRLVISRRQWLHPSPLPRAVSVWSMSLSDDFDSLSWCLTVMKNLWRAVGNRWEASKTTASAATAALWYQRTTTASLTKTARSSESTPVIDAGCPRRPTGTLRWLLKCWRRTFKPFAGRKTCLCVCTCVCVLYEVAHACMGNVFTVLIWRVKG